MKNFKVEKFYSNGKYENLGVLPETDVKAILKGCKYDNIIGMWFTPKSNIGYSIEEC